MNVKSVVTVIFLLGIAALSYGASQHEMKYVITGAALMFVAGAGVVLTRNRG